jgi:DNA-directed RNA polymerase subunit RPC12/RpoP
VGIQIKKCPECGVDDWTPALPPRNIHVCKECGHKLRVKPKRWTNKDRSQAAKKALLAHSLATGLTKSDGVETAIGDLLADLMHLCDAEKVDFEKMVCVARGYYDHDTEDLCGKCGTRFSKEDQGCEKDLCPRCLPKKRA